MGKIKNLFIMSAIFWGMINSAYAVVDFNKTDKNLVLTYTSFMDYPPFGDYHIKQERWGGITEKYETIFSNFATSFFNSLDISFKILKDKDYSNLVRRVRAGEADVIFGTYYNTKQYDGLDFVMPAILDNPVVLIMLPSNVNKVKSLDDLKKLKGAIFAKDKFNDFVNSELQKYDISTEEESLEIFRKLFVGEIDYIFATYYFSIAEASNLGLRNKLSISKQAIWNMPMFIGVAKASPHHKSVMQSLIKFSEKTENKKLLIDALANKVREYEQKSLRITPPIFSK